MILLTGPAVGFFYSMSEYRSWEYFDLYLTYHHRLREKSTWLLPDNLAKNGMCEACWLAGLLAWALLTGSQKQG
jgi:hypothetical protein